MFMSWLLFFHGIASRHVVKRTENVVQYPHGCLKTSGTPCLYPGAGGVGEREREGSGESGGKRMLAHPGQERRHLGCRHGND